MGVFLALDVRQVNGRLVARGPSDPREDYQGTCTDESFARKFDRERKSVH